jgi:LAO/AO transport system kinase
MWQELSESLQAGDTRGLARSISLVENEQDGYLDFLQALPASHTPILGITGPPGAGKSTLTDALIGGFVNAGKKVAVLCIDPSSPFNLGALLGDRIRMSQWYNHPDVFIRSLANRGNLGGLHPMIIEITEVVKAAPFDHIIIETVGIGQSEIEIAGLADTTVVVLVPEAGDEIQTMKAGLMEIADIFVVNKSDRPDAELFVRNLRQMLSPIYHRQQREIPVIKTIASESSGTGELMEAILHQDGVQSAERKAYLLTRRAWQMLQRTQMKAFNMQDIQSRILEKMKNGDFNLVRFVNEVADKNNQ